MKSYNFFLPQAMEIPVGKLGQVAELSILPGSEICEHTQYCDEITYVISGKARFYSNGECSELHGGQIHFIKKGAVHKIEAFGEENLRYSCVGIEPDYSLDIFKELDSYFQKEYFIINDDGSVRNLIELMTNEIYQSDNKSKDMLNMYISQIFIAVYRLLKKSENVDYKKKKFDYDTSEATFFKLLRYIDREYLNIKYIKDVSDELSYSNYYLTHLFKQYSGMTIKEYILNKKVTDAKNLLLTTNLSVADLSDYLNFSTYHTFTQAFKRIAGISPTEYKNINSNF